MERLGFLGCSSVCPGAFLVTAQGTKKWVVALPSQIAPPSPSFSLPYLAKVLQTVPVLDPLLARAWASQSQPASEACVCPAPLFPRKKQLPALCLCILWPLAAAASEAAIQRHNSAQHDSSRAVHIQQLCRIQKAGFFKCTKIRQSRYTISVLPQGWEYTQSHW